MEIRPLSDELAERYERFLGRHDAAMVYYSLSFKSFLEAILGCQAHYLVALANQEIVGVLPAMWQAGSNGAVVNALPFFGSHGAPLAQDPEVAGHLIRALDSFEPGPPLAARVVIDNPFAPASQTIAHNLTDERVSHVTPLPPRGSSREEILKIIESSARRNVTKAERNGITVRVDNAATEFLSQTHVENMQAIGGLAKERIFFDEIPRRFAPDKEYALYVAECDGRPVAALLLLYFGDTVEYFVPVILADFRSRQPLALIILQAMQDAVDRGFKRWNWGGTWPSQTGVARFKQKWGARESRYRYFIQLYNDDLLNESPASLRAAYPGFYVVPYSALRVVA